MPVRQMRTYVNVLIGGLATQSIFRTLGAVTNCSQHDHVI